MSILFVGDVHGHIDDYRYLVRNHKESIQVGDMGLGFAGIHLPEFQTGWRKFIRGNHDEPEICRKHLDYLGDWGYLPDKKIFFVSGADSIDKQYRIPGVSWWAGEELNHDVFKEVIEKYKEIKPEIMVTHACPDSMKNRVLNGNAMKIDSRTEHYFQQMLEIHRPSVWIFGHYHISQDFVENGTRFVCLAELETKLI